MLRAILANDIQYAAGFEDTLENSYAEDENKLQVRSDRRWSKVFAAKDAYASPLYSLLESWSFLRNWTWPRITL